jgi:hypothetical protein
MPLILASNSASGGYNVANSLRFNSASSDSLTRTAGTFTSRDTFTVSAWVKFSGVSGPNQNPIVSFDGSNQYMTVRFNPTTPDFDNISYQGSTIGRTVSTALYRDFSAWYHILVAIDSTQATASNRIRSYVNGTEITSFSSSTYPSQNTDMISASMTTIRVGAGVDQTATTSYFGGYMAEVYYIDGQQLTPSSFGETDTLTGIWKPKAYVGTFGNNGFYLQFKNSAALGTDSSGNGNTYTVNNLTSVDQSTDTCTNNFCTLNYIQNGNGSTSTLTEGNLVASGTDNRGCSATFGVNRGKWYWEVKTVGATGINQYTGVSNRANEQNGDASPGQNSANIRSYCGNGVFKNYSAASNNANASFIATNGTIYSYALDLDSGTLARYVNGSLINTDTTLPSDNSVTFFPYTGSTYSGGGGWNDSQFNFGSPMYTGGGYADAAGYGNFSYAVPSGYYSLCTKNLANFG